MFSYELFGDFSFFIVAKELFLDMLIFVNARNNFRFKRNVRNIDLHIFDLLQSQGYIFSTPVPPTTHIIFKSFFPLFTIYNLHI